MQRRLARPLRLRRLPKARALRFVNVLRPNHQLGLLHRLRLHNKAVAACRWVGATDPKSLVRWVDALASAHGPASAFVELPLRDLLLGLEELKHLLLCVIMTVLTGQLVSMAIIFLLGI